MFDSFAQVNLAKVEMVLHLLLFLSAFAVLDEWLAQGTNGQSARLEQNSIHVPTYLVLLMVYCHAPSKAATAVQFRSI